MLKVYGQGRPTTIVNRVDHHARTIADLVAALMNGILASEVARDDEVHHLHLGKGANGANLYLASGAKFAFRAAVNDRNAYDRIEVLDAPKNGTVVATVRSPRDVPAAVGVIERAR